MQDLQFLPLWLGVRLEFWYVEISQVPMTDVYARIRRSYENKIGDRERCTTPPIMSVS